MSTARVMFEISLQNTMYLKMLEEIKCELVLIEYMEGYSRYFRDH